MSIPYNDSIKWGAQESDPFIDTRVKEAPLVTREDLFNRAVKEISVRSLSQLVTRGFQFGRDALRLVLKVPVRAVKTPFIFEKYWKQKENAKINAKLTGYSFVQLLSVPVKFMVALTALATLSGSAKKSQWLLDKSDDCTAYLDGRASQLEALKEEGLKEAKDNKEYESYKNWLYRIPPRLCRKQD